MKSDTSLVKVNTPDGLILHGLSVRPTKTTDKVIIHIHGSSGSFYFNSFYPYLFEMATKNGFAFLSTNSRGSDVYNVEAGVKPTGAAVEIFEECLIDIDTWIEFAVNQGYKNIILEGHSFGTNKIQYYLQKGKYKDIINSVILLGFCDSYGGQLVFLKKNCFKNEDILNEAKKLVSEGKPYQLLSHPFINWGELPQAAESYISHMSPDSELSKILPLKVNGKLPNFAKIDIPILGIVGDHDECTVIEPQNAVNLLNNANKNAKCFMIKGSNHQYTGKEQELVALITSFIRERFKD